MNEERAPYVLYEVICITSKHGSSGNASINSVRCLGI